MLYDKKYRRTIKMSSFKWKSIIERSLLERQIFICSSLYIFFYLLRLSYHILFLFQISSYEFANIF
jgi:hypothetical protein